VTWSRATRLRVCADPANLPFSNERREGFENRIAQLLGDALGLPVEYVFFPQVQGFVRNTLRAGRCDLVMGTVAGDDLMQNTNPYYHTAYVMVVRRGAEVPERLDDPRMRALRLGAIARTPPVDLLLRHGLMTNTRFFPLAVDTRVEAPGADMVRAVADGAWMPRWSGVRSPASRRRRRACPSSCARCRPSPAPRGWISASPWACAGRRWSGAGASMR
jgi:ABC-type amino acid transport substrate-binding protein